MKTLTLSRSASLWHLMWQALMRIRLTQSAPSCVGEWFHNQCGTYSVRARVFPLDNGKWGAELVSRTGTAGCRQTTYERPATVFTGRRQAMREAEKQAKHLATLRYRYGTPQTR
ncbi:hypothetical protein [Cedecea sp.]|uniref:hypothetical protein n=1 Tax=Cedecea sp. TaxID=1970739 RepID=UPI002F409F6B